MPLAERSTTWAAFSLVIRFGPDGTLPPGISPYLRVIGQEHHRQVALQVLLLVDRESGFTGGDALQEVRRHVERGDAHAALARFLHGRNRRLAGERRAERHDGVDGRIRRQRTP